MNNDSNNMPKGSGGTQVSVCGAGSANPSDVGGVGQPSCGSIDVEVGGGEWLIPLM